MKRKTLKELADYAERLRKKGKNIQTIFCCILMEFFGTPYVWGGQSPQGSDCSGSVCTALSLATRRAVRMTADSLYRNFFTENVTDFANEKFLYAAFFLDESERAVHVAGWCGGRYLNESRCEPTQSGTFRTEAELRSLYPNLKMKKRGMRI